MKIDRKCGPVLYKHEVQGENMFSVLQQTFNYPSYSLKTGQTLSNNLGNKC